MKRQFLVFIIRWLLNSFALWLAIKILGVLPADTSTTYLTYLGAGLLLSVANSILRPIIIILSLPAILVTLGLFMFVVNGLMVYIVIKLVPHLDISFFSAILVGMIVSLTNYVLSGIMELRTSKPQEI